MEEMLAPVYDLMDHALEDHAFPGAVLAVGQREQLAIRTFGVTTPDEGGASVEAGTIYDLASLSKLFTATAALMLLERGQMRLDDPVGRFLPVFSSGDKEGIRLRHLLTHTSGLPAFGPYYQVTKGQAEMLEAIAKTPLQYATGQQVVYSCLGFITLANVIQTITGQGLDQFLKENLFAPLGMGDTGYGPVNAPRTRIAPTEYCSWRGKMVWGEVHDENAYAQGGVGGNAGLFSTAPDLICFAQMMLGMGDSETVLSPATIRAATQNYTPGLQENRGLGWQVRSREYPWCGDLAPANSFGHTGFTGTSLWISPDDQLFVVLLTNRVHPTRENLKHIRYRSLIHNAIIAAVSRASHAPPLGGAK